ncbi:LANO_0H10814g1_1 [Lachancea nothofagi CBS 11611]|uniref:LANO_0H10814g1_1 n=1 Tax=Lachancea nothofagi CBS 11611 TaxID=1266666 RepID=A0A1G4KM13_9SACH|nr:LANO_0H10814g1_1 [Lachancea nothofagi CBS 11611]
METTPLLADRKQDSESYNGYVSDGRSVGSDEVHMSRFRLMSPDIEDPENADLTELSSPLAAQMNATTLKHEARVILSKSGPLTMTFFMEYSMTVTSLFVVGHFGTSEHLASASLAAMTFNITGLAVIEGMATSLDTFCAQAYGAQKYTKVGLYFQRCTAMIAIAAIPISLFWWTSAFWLRFVIPEHQLLDDAQSFLQVTSFGLPGLILFETGKRYVQAQGFYDAGTWVLAIAVPLNILISIVLTKSSGYIGAPTALAITDWLMALILFIYCRYFEPSTRNCWYPFNASWHHFKHVFQHWGTMWSLAFPGLVMIESEYLSFEVLTIMSTHFGVEAIAAQSVVANVGSLIYQVPFAMGCVVSTRIAAYIGMENMRNAKTTVKASYYIAFFAGILNCLILLLGNKWLARLFTKNEEVIVIAYHIMPILAINQLYDSVATFGAAILRSQGRQSLGGVLNVVGYYFIGLPLSGWFAFGPLQLGLKGLWYGCGVGILVLAISSSICVYKSNWTKIHNDFLAREDDEMEVDLLSVDTGSAISHRYTT